MAMYESMDMCVEATVTLCGTFSLLAVCKLYVRCIYYKVHGLEQSTLIIFKCIVIVRNK